jgi:hypothetical protein
MYLPDLTEYSIQRDIDLIVNPTLGQSVSQATITSDTDDGNNWCHRLVVFECNECKTLVSFF